MFEPGLWNAICQRCGFKFKSDKLRLEWTGLRVCQECWEPKHPQMSVKGRADKQAPPWTSPEGPDVFVTPKSWDDL